ncbi:hypothetical protein C0Q70_05990 [Pomacea canaliculata]|uniref:Uncharacterized protein n=1 Tax=Pomacea canaliculata TaxID=400727 RepID=A0A2T7PMS0_POMCA|nr:hypothetical protein C0Q70_05990 [Pomacea canaliculata]
MSNSMLSKLTNSDFYSITKKSFLGFCSTQPPTLPCPKAKLSHSSKDLSFRSRARRNVKVAHNL